jgi:predicted methyltransferase
MNLHAVTEVEVEPRVQRLLDAPDRDEADRTLDGARQSGDLLTYLDVWPGMRVAEIGAGSGYLTELLARSVGPRGHVIAQNDSALLRGDVRDAWASRLARPAMRNVEALDSAYATPLPPGTRNLDCVYVGAEYGLLVARGVDRAAMNRAAYAALAPGGRYVVLDRVLPPDSIEGHREASASARREIESAGFSFKSEGRFLRGSNDARDWNAAPNARAGDGRGAGDWFLLTFVKRAQPTLP